MRHRLPALLHTQLYCGSVGCLTFCLGYGLWMTFENQIENLCKQAAQCKSESEAVEIARRIQRLMHARVDELRSNLTTLQAVASSDVIKQSP
jgi:hypothetical protein